MNTAHRVQPERPGSPHPFLSRLRAGWLRVFLFTLVWWILTDGAPGAWAVGVPVVLCAALASILLLPPFSCTLTGLARFVLFFLGHSLAGGVDVARRAFHPRLPISPGLYEYRWRLPEGLSRVVMANAVSLLPGTLSTRLGKRVLQIHVLDRADDPAPGLAAIELRVAEMFGIDLAGPGPDGHDTRSREA